MFSPVMTCGKCAGRGFRPFLGPLFIECRRCGGSGKLTKLSARIISRLRYGASEEY
jgi:hypothetical protein